MPPAIPIATYRLQLTSQFGFDRAAELVPYLKNLGISHLYVSPFLKARSGSTHGYDVIDHNELNPELGGEGAFRRLSEALATADLGLILDFVPNHMGVHYADNAWWLDVLEWGPRSPYADYFDIDWALLAHRPSGGVLIPILGTSYGEALENGEIELRYDGNEGSFSVWYYEHRLPITPTRYAEILDRIVSEAGARDILGGWKLVELAARYRGPRNPSPQKAPALKAELAAIREASGIIERGLVGYRPKTGGTAAVVALHYLLERQHYRLAHWRLSASDINYRRFFDINSLAGLRVEDSGTFNAIHRLVARLIGEGRLQGLRLDHIDGLRDPQQYLQRLQRLIGGIWKTPEQGRFYVVVEKILAKDEQLPRFSGVAGTTGYECLNTICHVLADGRGFKTLDQTWKEAGDIDRSFQDILIESKRRVLTTILLSEFTVLARLLDRIAAGHYSTRDYTAEHLRAALELFVLHFPVYRTYITRTGPSPADYATIDAALAKSRGEWVGADASIFEFLRDVITLDLVKPPRAGHSGARVRRFAFKLQQFTGPVMAKSLEDTAFYRYHRLLALNEVGGDPGASAMSVTDFHASMAERARVLPHGLTTTATHDTKRGEDARMRILALSELAEEWRAAVARWRTLNSDLLTDGPGRSPSPAHEYMLYQALVGAWPLGGIDSTFVRRTQEYALKAVREGKEKTSWLDPNQQYETGVAKFLERILNRDTSAHFLAAFESFVRRIALLGALNSLSQLALKLTLPGVPDLYQGTEFWDLSLVDPDNRTPVDFATRAAALCLISDPPDWSSLAAAWPDARIKLALTRVLTSLRQRISPVFAQGDYTAVEVGGPHDSEIIAFARTSGRDAVIVAAGRWFSRATDGGRRWPEGAGWKSCSVAVDGFSSLRNVLTGARIVGSRLYLDELFQTVPVAVIQARRG